MARSRPIRSAEVLDAAPEELKEGVAAQMKRKRRGPSRENMDLVEMGQEALRLAGGVNYLVYQAFKNPASFLGWLGKITPLQIRAEAANLQIIVQQCAVPAEPGPGVIASPIEQHVLRLVAPAQEASRDG